MNSCKAFLLSLFLLGLVSAQTNFNNTCQNDSLIPLLATGTINLNPLDTYNNGGNKDFTQDLSLGKFQPVDVLGYAFALSGFQTNCGQNFYALVVDTVIFENQNTRMRIVVDFRNTNDGTITKWNLVTFTYIVVSRNLNGAYSDVWATVASKVLTATWTGAIDELAPAFQNPAGVDCKTYVDPNLNVDTAACAGAATTADPNIGGALIIHAYVMGFRWNSNKSTTHFLAASVFNPNTAAATPPGSLPGSAESGDLFTLVRGAVNVPPPPAVNGPTVTIDNFGGALEFIKVAFVYSRYDKAIGDAAVTQSNLDVAAGRPPISVFPTGSFLKYTSSYIYEKVTKFNTTVPLIRGVAATTYTYNQNYWRMPDARFAIYGLTGFDLPKSTTTTCGSQIWINATLNSINSYNMFTPNLSPTNFYFSADIFTVRNDFLCASTDPLVTPTFTDITTVGKKSYFTVPTQSLEQFIQEDPTLPFNAAAVVNTFTALNLPISNVFNSAARFASTLFLQYYGAKNGNNDTILFRAEIPFTGLTVGAPIQFEFGYGDPLNPIGVPPGNPVGMEAGVNYTVELRVNGFVLYQNVYTARLVGTNWVGPIMKGLNVQSTVANVVITISYPRHILRDQNLYTYIIVSQYAKAYNPSTGCCTASCPASTGLDVVLTPPTCVACDTRAGLFYNPNNGTCTCLSGFYLDSTKTFQCYPCTALYCSICNPINPAQCTTCATGATLNFNYTCTCGDGFFINGTVCQQCPIACQTCTTNGICLTCVDTQHRDINQGCNCITGFFHSGSVNCSACSGTCRTCTNATACTSCDASKFRSLNGAICTCMAGYYEMYNDDQSRTCQKCNPECLTCAISPTSCTSCDPKKNRLQGMDDFGHQTCLCQPGFYSTPDGSCVQSNCVADPFCSLCEQGLKLCVQCLASKNRIIKLPESICVCMDGYYADASNNCVPCNAGCGICKSATNCSSCVALATPSGNGACSCPARTYFTISTDGGVRYCASCGSYCSVCVNATTCTTCLPSFTKTVDNQCVCSAKNYIDAKGNCVPCASGCQTCTSNANCSKCIDPLVLQGTVCQANCNDGFTALGSICIGCPSGCLQCTQNFICFYCADGLYMYNGKCYDICPAGTIGDSTGGNWNCVPCNSPCKTCINHPSYCTSCENGKGYLQTSAVQQSCVETCNDGTFAQGGVCQVCDFKCATCLGSATNCISCPANQVLYKGGCWAACPAILLSDNKVPGAAGSCVDNCPDGFYKASETECVPCSIQCPTCNGGPDNCTSCLQGSVSTNGTCTVKCGENQFSFQGICVACSPSCYGCQYTPQNCLDCATGYVRSGSICQKGCLAQQYFDASQQKCVNCDSKCGSCSSYSYCLTCANPAINPRGGVCSSCPYPCASCDGTGACTTCLSGFYFFQSRCQTTCPTGAAPVNGVCRCNSGIVSNGKCVASCASGFTSIAGSCVPCNSNCAECSGNVNSCTKCLSGFSIDANSQKCVSSTQCPYGQEANNGKCEAICDGGFFYYEGICIYGGCFTGYADNGFGGCTRKTGAEAASVAASCSAGQFILKGKCVADCGTGFYPDTASSKCLPCSANCLACFNANFCVNCQLGFTSNSGVCSASTACDSTQYQYGSTCVNSCPVGTFVQGSQCQRSCPDNTFYQSQICYINCPSGLRTGDACVTSCPAGTTNKSGVCV